MTMHCDRHLLEVDLRSIPAYRFEFVVLGFGVAGGTDGRTAPSSGKSVDIGL